MQKGKHNRARATTLVGLSEGCKIKLLYRNVDNPHYGIAMVDWKENLLEGYTVGLIRSDCEKCNIYPVDMLPDGAGRNPHMALYLVRSSIECIPLSL